MVKHKQETVLCTHCSQCFGNETVIMVFEMKNDTCLNAKGSLILEFQIKRVPFRNPLKICIRLSVCLYHDSNMGINITDTDRQTDRQTDILCMNILAMSPPHFGNFTYKMGAALVTLNSGSIILVL